MNTTNKPYVKQYSKKGFLLNPIKDFYLTNEPKLTRRARRQAGKFNLPIKSHQAIPLKGKDGKFNGKFRHINHYEISH